MTIIASGAISLLDIQDEFGGTTPISLSEYYRGGAFVVNSSFTANITTSGAIDVNSFHSAKQAYWSGWIYPEFLADDGTGSNVFGYDLAGGLGSIAKDGGAATLNRFFWYGADGNTYVDTSLTDGTTLVIQKGMPGTDTFILNDGGNSNTPPSTWLTGNVFVSIAPLG